MARQSRAVWRGRVSQWVASGLSCRQFAEQAGLKANTLSWWKWKLGSEEAAADCAVTRGPTTACAPDVEPTGARAGDQAGDDCATAAFVEVTALLSDVDGRPAGPGVGLQLACGEVRIEVPVGFDAPTLSRVLGVLQEVRR